jgi:hypothetical protein
MAFEMGWAGKDGLLCILVHFTISCSKQIKAFLRQGHHYIKIFELQ